MAKVFSAKRKSVEFEYEFLDGAKAKFVYSELPQKEMEMLLEFDEEEHTTTEKLNKRKEIFKKQIKAENEKLIDKLIEEQYEYGNLFELIGELDTLLVETRKKK